MRSVNKRSLVIYKVTCAKKVRLVKFVLIDLSQKIHNSIAKGLLSAIDYVRSSAKYENEQKV